MKREPTNKISGGDDEKYIPVQVLVNGFSMSIPSMICPVWRSSVRIFAALALDAADTIRASQNEIL
jgi:hypothetical protein